MKLQGHNEWYCFPENIRLMKRKFFKIFLCPIQFWLDCENSLKTAVVPLSSTLWDPGEKIQNPLSQSNKDTKDTDVKDHKRYPKRKADAHLIFVTAIITKGCVKISQV